MCIIIRDLRFVVQGSKCWVLFLEFTCKARAIVVFYSLVLSNLRRRGVSKAEGREVWVIGAD